MTQLLRVTFSLLLCLGLAPGARAEVGSPVGGVTLDDLAGRKVLSDSLAAGPLDVFVAGGTSCPVMRRYLPVLNESFAKWHKRGVNFYLIDLAAQDDLKAIRAEYKQFKPAFPVYFDPQQQLGKKIGFLVTGEIAVLDPAKNSIIYKGAIDDRYLLGEDRHRAKENFLESLLLSWSEGKPVAQEKHRAFGCAITYRN